MTEANQQHRTPTTGPDFAALRAALGERLTTDPALIANVARDSSRYEPEGSPAALVTARSTADVQAALAWANEHGVPVSVRGAGTGLAGGAAGYDGGLILSLAEMNQIISIDPADRLADVQPGVITAVLDDAARRHGLFFPPDPASARTSTVGGNIATNAGGLRCIAHGVTRDAVAALEVVLADGTVIHTGARTRKNVVGLDLTSLFVGSEGTLGVITRATVRLKPVPEGPVRTFRASFDAIGAAGDAVTEIVGSAVPVEVLELLDAESVRLIEQYQPSGLQVPGAAVLIGQSVGPGADHAARRVVEICARHGATEATDHADESLLEARRIANPALRAAGLRVSCDVGVPVSRLAEMFAGIERVAEQHGRRVSVVAHAGDGNLHPTVEAADTPEGYRVAAIVLDDITRLALSLGGTISGEHGIGAVKRHELPWQLDAGALAAQRAIKLALDPRGILTPGRAL